MNSKHIIFILVLLGTACHPDKNKKVDIDKLNFTTTDASELFFRNVRKSEYLVEDLSEGGIEVYRYETPGQGKTLLSPALVVNWRNDQAFLILEKDEELPDELTILLKNSLETDTLLFDAGFQRQHAELAVHIYNALLEKKEIFLLHREESFVLFTDQEKIAFKRMVFDFLRLVELR